MSATIQPDLISELAGKFGRTAFSKSIWMPPNRSSLTLALRITPDIKLFVAAEIRRQQPRQRAIVFCLFKSNVSQFAAYIESAIPDRRVFQCTSGKASDCTLFNASDSAIMVCTTVLATGVSFEKVSRVYFLDCSHGPEVFLQGAGRGARCDGESCIATLVTNRQQLETFQKSPNMAYVARMASFCLKCIEQNLNFADEICRLFEHSTGDLVFVSNDLILDSTITAVNTSNLSSGSQLQVTVHSNSNPAVKQSRTLNKNVLSHDSLLQDANSSHKQVSAVSYQDLLLTVHVTICTKSHLPIRITPLSFVRRQPCQRVDRHQQLTFKALIPNVAEFWNSNRPYKICKGYLQFFSRCAQRNPTV